MSEAKRCQRCNLPVGEEGYHLWLEAKPPDARSLDLMICDLCLASFRRWMLRQGARPHGAREESLHDPTPRADEYIPRVESAGASPYAGTLERELTSIRVRLYLTTAAFVLIGIALLGGLAYFVVMGSMMWDRH